MILIKSFVIVPEKLKVRAKKLIDDHLSSKIGLINI